MRIYGIRRNTKILMHFHYFSETFVVWLFIYVNMLIEAKRVGPVTTMQGPRFEGGFYTIGGC